MLRGLQERELQLPHVAYHALLQACSRCRLGNLSRLVFEQLQAAVGRPDVQSVGWYAHALIESSCLTPELQSMQWPFNHGLLSPLTDHPFDYEQNTCSRRSIAIPIATTPIATSTASPLATSTAVATNQPVKGETDHDDSADDHAVSERASRGIQLGLGAQPPREQPVAQGDAGLRRLARLRVRHQCASCFYELRAHDALAGWYASLADSAAELSAQRCDSYHCAAGVALEYSSSCPQCGHRWYPLIDISLSGPMSEERAAEMTDLMAAEAADAPGVTDESADATSVQCHFLSPSLLLQEVVVALQSAHGQRALSEGWTVCRDMFPSLYWNLCWHLGPEGLLRSLPHFKLAPVRAPDAATTDDLLLIYSPGAQEVGRVEKYARYT